ncbi:hypothetical protein J3R30DRAFT_1330128 [Lentinula aciculospora]|uniref:Uncharacterized protein n=1 Tax=Lentinula aciculospora TaxID=153920 RepID=A0A9W9ANB4_9AGAR|nr:hypothetical protein J3R30DRAFT_1330128 [Lentinula aciculospora]
MIASLLTLRIYALYGCNKRILIFLSSLILIGIVLAIVTDLLASSTPVSLSIPSTGCHDILTLKECSDPTSPACGGVNDVSSGCCWLGGSPPIRYIAIRNDTRKSIPSTVSARHATSPGDVSHLCYYKGRYAFTLLSLSLIYSDQLKTC